MPICNRDLSLILSAQRALFNRVTKNVKAIYSTIVGDKLTWIVYYDTEPTEDEIELQRIATTEIVCDFPEIMSMDEQFLYHPEPIRMENTKYYNWIFSRYEGDFSEFSNKIY